MTGDPFGDWTPMDEPSDPDPHGGYIPPEHEPQGFLTVEQVDEKFDAWIALYEAERDDSPDRFGW